MTAAREYIGGLKVSKRISVEELVFYESGGRVGECELWVQSEWSMLGTLGLSTWLARVTRALAERTLLNRIVRENLATFLARPPQ